MDTLTDGERHRQANGQTKKGEEQERGQKKEANNANFNILAAKFGAQVGRVFCGSPGNWDSAPHTDCVTGAIFPFSHLPLPPLLPSLSLTPLFFPSLHAALSLSAHLLYRSCPFHCSSPLFFPILPLVLSFNPFRLPVLVSPFSSLHLFLLSTLSLTSSP